MKKYWPIFLILAIIIAVILILVFKPNKKSDQAKNQDVISSGDNSATIQKISNNKSYFPQIINNSLYYYYLNQIYNYKTPDKAIAEIDSAPVEIHLSPDLTQAIVKIHNDKGVFKLQNSIFYNESLLDGFDYYWLYNLKTQKAQLLNQDISSVAWSPNSKKIIYTIGTDSGQALSISDPGGSNWKIIAKLNLDVAFADNNQNSTLLYTEVQGDTGDYEDKDPNFTLYKFNWNNLKLSKLDSKPAFLDTRYCGSNIVQSDYEKDGSDIVSIFYAKDGKNEIINESLDYQNFVCSDKYLASSNIKDKNKIFIYNLETKEKKEITLSFESNNLETENLIGILDKTLFFTADDYLYRIQLKP